jgi:WD40 repeat protein
LAGALHNKLARFLLVTTVARAASLSSHQPIDKSHAKGVQIAMATSQHSDAPELPESSTFYRDVSIKVDDEGIGAASISPSGRDVVLGTKTGLLILDLDSPYSPPRHIIHRTDWMVADVQWSPFAQRSYWIASTANQKALIFNLEMTSAGDKAPIEHTLHGHSRAITDINFSAHHPDVLATCAVDSFVYTWDLRTPQRMSSVLSNARQGEGLAGLKPSFAVGDFEAGATQVKWNRQNENYLASSHDNHLHIWDTRQGALPVTSILAHPSGKICGIDWHRSNPTKILTCSLDQTVKLWDDVGVAPANHVHVPARVMHSDYPVRRARYTPFPNGILVMPQRGSSKLNLHTHVMSDTPSHTFQAHDDDSGVQEFLWRTRGSAENDIDNREYQLVSWGTDRHLHLYNVSADVLFNAVGYKKGSPIVEMPSTTRKGAEYITYRDEHPRTSQPSGTPDRPSQMGALSSLLHSSRISDNEVFNTSNTSSTGLQRTTMTASTIRHGFGRPVNTIAWMDGVRMGDNVSAPREDRYRWTIRDELAAEVAHVGKKYTKVAFEHIAVPDRRITVSFQGPWGDIDTSNTERKGERKLAFLRLTINFPEHYPRGAVTKDNAASTEPHPQDAVIEDNAASSEPHPQSAVTEDNAGSTEPYPLEIEFHRTTAAIDDAVLTKIQDDMYQIALRRAAYGQDALEAIICYGLGERGLEDSLFVPEEPEGGHDSAEPELGPEEAVEGESSSDDDDEESGMGNSQNIMNSFSLSNTNVPLPVQSIVRFSAPGLLVVVRIPSADPSLSFLSSTIRMPRNLGQDSTRNEIFESFGRLTIPPDHDSASPNSSVGSWDWSSSPSSSSGSDKEAGMPLSRFQPPIAWLNPALRFQSKTSHPSSTGVSKGSKAKSVVYILASSIEEFVPSKRCLAEEYRVFGDGPQVCLHNADVARRFGFEDLADIWELCRLILNNEVPLDILPQQHRREQVLVLARRALVRIKRKDSGLDLQFDEADTVTNPKLKGRIKWGHHSVVTWLIPALFAHFERLADTQMLAMLSCVFSEPAARKGVTSTMSKTRHSNLPMSMEAPAFSIDYFPSADAAWSLFKPNTSISSTPAHSRHATPAHDFGWQQLTKNIDTYGSHGSSNGPWGSDTVASEPMTPCSTGNTPPTLSRAPTFRSTTSTLHTPFSTSPEQTHYGKKASAGNFASAIATLSRPFANAASSSPPVKSRMEADLSTSAPTSGVTWGATTFYKSGSHERNLPAPRPKHGKRASFGQADRVNVDYISDSDSEYAGEPGYDGASEYTAPLASRGEEASSIKVTLKNQDKFDDEACVSAPLLDMSKEWLYHAWREQYAEMLGCWGLVSKRAEVLKFNGLISYFPPEDSRNNPQASSIHLDLEGGRNDISQSTSGHKSRTSTLALPTMPQLRRSSSASPRDFSFNPEAMEFRPGVALEADDSIPPPEIFVSSEQYLRLSIPEPVTDEGNGDLSDTLLSTPTTAGATSRFLKPRPAISRNASKNSSIAARSERSRKTPIYSCSICWIRVSGRFFLCPSCGHVAHFDCMSSSDNNTLDEGLGMPFLHYEEGECVVGCGCGCGFDDDDMAEHAGFGEEAITRWDEKGGWLPEEGFEGDAEMMENEGVHGDGVWKWNRRVNRKARKTEKLDGKKKDKTEKRA